MEKESRSRGSNGKETRFMRFFGGRDIYFILGLLILIGLTVFIFQKVSFIFEPLITVTTMKFAGGWVLLPVVLVIILAFIAGRMREGW